MSPYNRNVVDDITLAEKRKDSELKKTKKMIRGLHRPVLPTYCRIIFWCMLIAPLLNLVMELVSYIRAIQVVSIPLPVLLINVSTSMLIIWGFFAFILLIMAGIQYNKALKHGYEDRIYRFRDELLKTESLSEYEVVASPEKGTRDADKLILYAKKPRWNTKKRYLRYMLTAVIGVIALTIFYIISNSLTG